MKKTLTVALIFITLFFAFKTQFIYIGKLIQNDVFIWYYSTFKKAQTITYKLTERENLRASLFYPTSTDTVKKYPTIIFIHGGGWYDGGINQFHYISQHYQSKGYLCVLLEYRVKLRNNSAPRDAIADVRDAIQFFKKNQIPLMIDSNNFSIMGASAGGFLALVYTFCFEKNITFPKNLILYSPVINIGKSGFGSALFTQDEISNFSPDKNIPIQINTNLLLFHGEKDNLIPISQIREFVTRYEEVTKGKSELVIINNSGHQFPKSDQLKYCLDKIDEFLNRDHR